eukprot:Pgem_evm1s2511
MKITISLFTLFTTASLFNNDAEANILTRRAHQCPKRSCPNAAYPNICWGNDYNYFCCPKKLACAPKAERQKISTPSEILCCDPSIVTVTKIDNFKYDKVNPYPTPGAQAMTATIFGNETNKSNLPTTAPEISIAFSSTQSATYSFKTSLTISSSVKITTGVPEIAQGSVSIGLSITFSATKTHTKTVGVKQSILARGMTIPRFSRQQIQILGKIQSFNVPFTATVSGISCGQPVTRVISGHTQIKGVADFTSASVKFNQGPAVPVECKSPFNVPFKQQDHYNFW